MGVKKRKKNKAAVIVIFFLCAFLFALYKGRDLIKAPSSLPQKVDITIPAGSSNQQIAGILAKNNVIKNELAFLFFSKYLGYDKCLKAGNYVLDSSWDLPEILEELSKGQMHFTTFTIPEGYNIEQIAERLAEKGLVNKEKFLVLADDPRLDFPLLPKASHAGYLLEGYLFPDTYQVTAEMTEVEIIKVMLNRFAEVYDKDLQNKVLEMGLTDHEVITIASMIEREAKFDVDRPLIASVIYNRLGIGMPLQIDATIQFALGTPKAKLTTKDLAVDSSYNTYKNTGLPPGPIGAPGKASIQAALNPEKTDFLYYLAKKDGTHVFNKTFAEHKAAKQKYLK